jgi:polyisoprenoid-binding protein YceI
MSGTAGAKMTPEISTVEYAIDATKSRFTVRALATGLLSGFGHNPVIAIRDFAGTIRFAPEAISEASLNFTVKASSLALQSDASDKDRREIERLMNQQVLESAQYPEIIFGSTQVTGSSMGPTLFLLKVEGDLTLHGVTRRQLIAAQVIPMDGTMRAYGEVAIKQTDFNIKPVSVAGGALRIKDELKLQFDIVAKRAE